jgi:hypothetical protein
VNGEEEDFAHGANGTITNSACKTAQRGRIASHYEFASHTSNSPHFCSWPNGCHERVQQVEPKRKFGV